MTRIVFPLDSVAVVPAPGADAASAVWSERLAGVIARRLATCGDVRVVPHAIVCAEAASERSPEEIARHFNARCVVRCAVAVDGDALNVQIELIDALAEVVIGATSYAILTRDAFCVQSQITQWLQRRFGGQ